MKHYLTPNLWVDHYSDLLLNFAISRVGNRETAKDLVQDTFITALKGQDKFRGEISEKNWLFIVLKSRILDYYKKKKEVLESDFNSPTEDDSFFNEKGHWLKEKLPKEWTTDKMILNDEFMQVLTACKELLNESQSLVFTMKYLDGESSETICKELNISSSNYWVIVHRAKVQLRNCLEKNWME